MSGQPQASPSLGGLPTEILLILFRALPDIPSLGALALTNSVLFLTCITHASSISFAVLSNEIPAAILPEAIAAWSSSTVKPWSKAGVRKYLQDYHTDREAQIRQSWTLSNAFEVSKLHRRCHILAFKFSEFVRPTNLPSGSSPSLSSCEANRIQRSVHRFELYRNLFHVSPLAQEGVERFSDTEKYDIYFKHYAAWENEQLGCLHDYLVLSNSSDDILHEGLTAHPGELNGRLLRDLSVEEKREVANKPFFHEDDEGPEEAWMWAYTMQDTSRLYFASRLWYLRVWGFCLWDHARLNRLGVG